MIKTRARSIRIIFMIGNYKKSDSQYTVLGPTFRGIRLAASIEKTGTIETKDPIETIVTNPYICTT